VRTLLAGFSSANSVDMNTQSAMPRAIKFHGRQMFEACLSGQLCIKVFIVFHVHEAWDSTLQPEFGLCHLALGGMSRIDISTVAFCLSFQRTPRIYPWISEVASAFNDDGVFAVSAPTQTAAIMPMKRNSMARVMNGDRVMVTTRRKGIELSVSKTNAQLF